MLALICLQGSAILLLRASTRIMKFSILLVILVVFIPQKVHIILFTSPYRLKYTDQRDGVLPNSGMLAHQERYSIKPTYPVLSLDQAKIQELRLLPFLLQIMQHRAIMDFMPGFAISFPVRTLPPATVS